ncbi:phytoene desaturase family protein [Desulfosediminicola sp.]|uniref:phytoene desaturase family protein n=1 Tax=Desulfosediminicola sp. TaxID=2886825 RepID=UPI003AF2D9B9
MKASCIVIGGGLSGLAAAIRLARFIPDVLLLEQHTRLGGLNSYYYRNKTLFETGLHAITNYAEKGDKRAPLNRLLRQLKLGRGTFDFQQQKCSEVVFKNQASLRFSNDFEILKSEIAATFPKSIDGFASLITFLDEFDPFQPAPFQSAKVFLNERIHDPLLVDMLLCPLMYYGSSVENDMDLSQFAIMFQAIFREGFFRPGGTIKDFLSILTDHLTSLGGTVRKGARVKRLIHSGNKVSGVELASGETLECSHILSTIGSSETMEILGKHDRDEQACRLGFVESIFQMPATSIETLPQDKTVIFFSDKADFRYQQPKTHVDFSSGVICMPYNFHNVETGNHIEVRSTHLASWQQWSQARQDMQRYEELKRDLRAQSLAVIEQYVGNFADDIIYEDTFTPITIERYTSKKHGAIYGCPTKIKDGDIGFENLFLAGTDQGFLGIVGSMLSGVSIVNQHILPKY